MAREGTVTVKITGDSKGLRDALDDSDGKLSNFGGKMGGVAKGIATGFAGIGVAAVGFGAASVKAFMEAEKIGAQTGAVLKSTGGAAKVTAGDVETLAGSLSMMSGVDDEAIQSGQNLLLTFTKIRNEVGQGNDIFNQSTKAALDLSVAMGTDMTSASMLVGKALNDPLKGMTALTKSGIQFTDQQKEQIKSLVASGDTLGAQKIILKELETQFGGSAKAAGDTFAGQLDKLKVVAGNLMEQVGAKLVPILSDLAQWLTDHLPAAMTRAGEIFNTLKGYFDDGKRIFDTVRDAISGVVERFTSGGDQLGESGSKIGEILGQVKEVFHSAFEAVKAIVERVVAVVTDLWDRFGKSIVSFAKESFEHVVEVFKGALEVVTGVFDLIKAVLTGKWGEAWEAIKKILNGAWDAIWGILDNALTNVLPTIFDVAKGLLSAAWSAIWNGLKTIFGDIWAGIKTGISNALDGIVNFFKDLPGRLAGLGRGMFDFIGDAFKAALNWVIAKWNDFHIPAVRVSAFGVTQTVTPDIPFPNITPLAAGGPISGLALVGEKGPELFAGHGTIIPNHALGATVHNHYMTNNIELVSIDPTTAGRIVVQAIQEFERRNGADWRSR